MKGKSPFKFLDPYTEDDSEFFFGRSDEVHLLYEFIKKNRIVLVYGPSGSGKTSLVRCGLNSKMGPLNWCPVVIRRGTNINHAIGESLLAKFPEGQTRQSVSHLARNRNYHELIYRLGIYQLSPVYLIFDQFEEYLIMGNKKKEPGMEEQGSERDEFITFLQLLKSPQYSNLCSIIFIMREEFFGLLDKLERKIPGLSNRRLRVDPMQKNDVIDVISKTLDYGPFNITLDEDKRINVNKIYKAIYSGNREDTLLPHLQVYLELLWQEDYASTYGNCRYEGPGFPPLKISGELIDHFGDLGNVLEKFLEERKAIIREQLSKEFPKLEKDFLEKVLSELVSDFGTKIPVQYNVVSGNYRFPKIKKQFFENMDKPALNSAIKKLEENKVIRFIGNTMELAHDTLAKLVHEQRSKADKERITARMLVRNYYSLNKELHYESIKEWEDKIYELELSPEEESFLRTNLTKGRKLYKEEQYRQFKKRKKYKLLQLSSILLIITGVLLLYIFGSTLRTSDSYYALSFAKTSADTVSNPVKKLNLMMYLYFYRDEYSGSTKEALKKIILDQVNGEAIQKEFADANFKLRNTTPLKDGDVSVSPDGRYLMVKNDSAGNLYDSKYTLLRLGIKNNRLDTVQTFSGLTYAYFIPGTDSLLLARSDRGDSVSLQYPGNPNLYCLYDYKYPGTGGLIFKPVGPKRLLIDMNTMVAKNRSEDDNLFVRKSSLASCLLIPYAVVDKDSANRYVFKRYLEIRPLHGSRPLSFASDYSYSLSKDKRYLLFGQSHLKGSMRIFFADLTGSPLKLNILSDTGNTSFDFTEDGHVWLIKDSTLRIVDPLTRKELFRESYDFWPKYAYVPSLPAPALVMDWDQDLHLIGTGSSKVKDIPGEYIGKNRDGTSFSFRLTDSANKGHNLVQSYSFRVGQLVTKSDTINGNILRASATGYSGYLMVLVNESNDENSKERKLYILDSTLKVKGKLTMSANSIFGSNQNGNVMYYVRDNNLAVYTDFTRFSTAGAADFSVFENWFRNSGIAMKQKDFLYLKDSVMHLRFLTQSFPRYRSHTKMFW